MNIKIDHEKCTCCWNCILECSGGCFTGGLHDFMYYARNIEFDGTNCIDCMACTEPGFCPSGAVEVEA